MLDVYKSTVGPLQENCYLLADSETRQAVLLEPGDEAERLIAALASSKLTAIRLTHTDFDHIGALAEVYRQFPVLTDRRRRLVRSGGRIRFYGDVIAESSSFGFISIIKSQCRFA